MEQEGLNTAECVTLAVLIVGYIATMLFALREAIYESQRANHLERSNRELHWEIRNLQDQIK